MKFTCSTIINLPVKEVIDLWSNDSNNKEWQDGFINIELLEGIKGQVNSKSLITFRHGKRKMELIETVISNNLPIEKKALYEHQHMDNANTTSFIDLGNNQTKYISEINYFKFKNIMPKMMAFLFPGMFKKQVQKWQYQFKEFAENYNNNK